MSNYVDLKYINILSVRLEQFKQKGKNLFNFRCPYCGDSQKDKTKARGYLYAVKNDMFYKCHNCGHGTNMPNFIKDRDQKLYSEYCLEKFKKKPKKEEVDFKPKFDKVEFDDLNLGMKISDLKDTHPAKKFVLDRKIPRDKLDLLYCCNRFMTLVNRVKPGTFKDVTKDYPRLIIPFYDESGKLFAFQGRAFGKEQPKYITIKLDESKQKVYGLERVNFLQPIKVVEGPLDSLFLDNCLASAGADLKNVKKSLPEDQITYIYDNEPRNREIIKHMYSVIDKGYSLVIWPDDLKHKDINDMIISGLTSEQITDIIHNNTFSGLAATAKLDFYKRVQI
jgi:transcription elongation factor Elf1|tara:strand:+ start:1004 stop:2011 length:1008 start_codon:yes stop_codon:yes gene_type:complete